MFTVILVLTLAAEVDPEPPGAHMRVIASVDWTRDGVPPQRVEKHLVARSVNELLDGRPKREDKAAEERFQKEFDALLERTLKVKSLDWNRQMLILVAGGRQTTQGYQVEVTGLKVRGKTLTVSWKLHAPKLSGDAVVTYPATGILVPAHKGKVVFEQVK